MRREITGYHHDELGNVVAELSCLHNQHLYHRPPFFDRSWVLEEKGRAERLGSAIDCPLCDRLELPGDVTRVASAKTWDEASLPSGLRRAHKVAAGRWGRIVVEGGRLAFRAKSDPPFESVLGAGDVQAIPPLLEHEVEPLEKVRFRLEFLVKDVPVSEPERVEDDLVEGGDPACWAHVLCPDCGAVLETGHETACPARVGQKP